MMLQVGYIGTFRITIPAHRKPSYKVVAKKLASQEICWYNHHR